MAGAELAALRGATAHTFSADEKVDALFAWSATARVTAVPDPMATSLPPCPMKTRPVNACLHKPAVAHRCSAHGMELGGIGQHPQPTFYPANAGISRARKPACPR